MRGYRSQAGQFPTRPRGGRPRKNHTWERCAGRLKRRIEPLAVHRFERTDIRETSESLQTGL